MASDKTNDGISTVYAEFASEQHQAVEEALFYEGERLRSGEMSLEELRGLVRSLDEQHKSEEQHYAAAVRSFQGVKHLVEDSQIKIKWFERELRQQLEHGNENLLFRFILFQRPKNSMDAAVSFLAWNHARALFDLEDDFKLDLNWLRDERLDECFGVSESQITLKNFSVLAH